MGNPRGCPAPVFEANPAGCPAASDVGAASAITPIFSHPAERPRLFRLPRRQAFPDLEIVLQGEGVTLVLDGTRHQKGHNVEHLPIGPGRADHELRTEAPRRTRTRPRDESAREREYSFCGQKLAMPTAFVGQNGAEIRNSTPLSVTGCKPAIRVVRHSVKGKTATIVVSVPSAGRLVATGRGTVAGERQSEQGRHGDGETDSDEGRGGLPGQAPRSQAEGEDQPAVHPEEGKQAEDQRQQS